MYIFDRKIVFGARTCVDTNHISAAFLYVCMYILVYIYIYVKMSERHRETERVRKRTKNDKERDAGGKCIKEGHTSYST
jgi:hypothetical protein